jgi:parallel beta-helix repeat protein
MVILRNLGPSRTIPLLIIIVFFCPFARGKVIYVDNDGQADFDKIQAGIDAADYNDIVSVSPGTYYENIILKDGIILSGDGADVTIIDANGYGDVVDARANDAAISGFTLTNSGQFDSGHMNCGVYVDGSCAPIIKNNIIAHNKIGIGLWYGAYPDIRNNIILNNSLGLYIYGSKDSPSNPIITNNTIVNNEMDGITLRVMVSPVITNNIIVGHTTGINHNYVTGSPTISYNDLWLNDVNYLRDNNVDDTLAGPGSISVDPYFARSGRWVDVNDPNLAAVPNDPNAVWIDGDYHLKSQTGRWDPNSRSWVQDDITSPCIDAGDPNSSIGCEPLPNGGVINMGAYGGTAKASKSPSGTSIYTFVSEQSSIIRTGGIAGVRRTYILAGQFRLTVDFGARKAWFSNVEATGTDESTPDRKLDPNEVFNLTALKGTIDPNGLIRFTGQAADESDVVLDLTISEELVYLKGETIPPANSADYFIFNLDAVAQRKYGGGIGEPNDPYQIATAEDLMLLGENLEDYDKHFILTTDIDLDPNLPGRKVFDRAVIASDTDPTPNKYGYQLYDGFAFTGMFNGNGHTISHLTITGNSYLALFGRLDFPAEVNNLGLVDVNITGSGWFIGGVVGANGSWNTPGGNVTDCYSTGTVSGNVFLGGLVGENVGHVVNCSSNCIVDGNDSVGGLVGRNVSLDMEVGTMTNCYSTGAVSGNQLVGGLVGDNDRYVDQCYSISIVSGGSVVGGLVGRNCGTIRNSYTTGSVAGDSSVGGLAGMNGFATPGGSSYGVISNCYSASAVVGTTSVGGLLGEQIYGEVTNSFWDIQTSAQSLSTGGIGKTTAEMQTANTFLIWGACGSVWTIDEGQDYPHLAWENLAGDIINGPTYGGGNGTPENPFLIYTVEELNMVGLSFCDWDKNFKLMADIDLSGYSYDTALIAPYVDPSFMATFFTGVFDGNGHKISHLTIQGGGYLGLFGLIDSFAEVRDLGVVDVNIVGSGDRVGGLVGRNYGSVTHCYITGVISGISRVGGLVGGNVYGAVVTQCYSIDVVSGVEYVGGLVGGNDGFVTQCYSNSAVNATEWGAGGLVGAHTGTVTNCYSTGAVTGVEYVGGLVGGSSGRIANSYSTGLVSGSWDVAGLVGQNYNGDVTNCFWDIQTSGQITSAAGICKTTAEMQTASTFLEAGWDFVDESENGTEDIWWIIEGQDYPHLWWENNDN